MMKTWLQQQIEHIESVPESDYDDTGEHLYEIGPDDMQDFAYTVREAFIRTGYPADPPKHLVSKQDALYHLRRVAGWLEQNADFLTVEQAAERLQVSTDSIYDLVKQGLLKHTKVGRAIRIKPADLEHIHQDDVDSSAALICPDALSAWA